VTNRSLSDAPARRASLKFGDRRSKSGQTPSQRCGTASSAFSAAESQIQLIRTDAQILAESPRRQTIDRAGGKARCGVRPSGPAACEIPR